VTVLCDELDSGSGEGYYEAECLLVFLSDDSACQCLIKSCYNLVSGANLTGAYCLLPDAIISLEGEYARLHSSPALFRLRLLRVLLSNSIINHRFHWAYDLLWETTRSLLPSVSNNIFIYPTAECFCPFFGMQSSFRPIPSSPTRSPASCIVSLGPWTLSCRRMHQ